MTRSEHLAWAKERAQKEKTSTAMWGSFVNDMSKHPELQDHTALELGYTLQIAIGSPVDAVRFIDGFN